MPVPAVAAAVLTVLAIGALRRAEGTGGRWLVVLILACAAQAAIVAAVQHYDVTILRRVQPVTASLVPPLAWLAFAATALGACRMPQDGLHVAGPLATAVLVWTVPALLDVLVPGLFAGYGAAIAWRVRPGGDAAPGTRLEAGDRPARLWGLIALALIGSGASDVAIFVATGLGHGELRAWIITLGSTATLTLVGWLAISSDLLPDRGSARGGPPDADAAAHATEDAEIMIRLDRLIEETALHLDPDLSLSRLARRLGLPAKRLSAAVNRTTGANVSRHVNARRVAEACARLAAGDSVTSAWLGSGFATRSNFNREFTRVTGNTPSRWGEEHGARRRAGG